MYLIQKESCGIRLLVRKIKTLEYHILLVTNVNRNTKACLQDKATKIRVGHRVLLRSEGIVFLCSFKVHNILLRSIFEFLATYETQKNDAFFS